MTIILSTQFESEADRIASLLTGESIPTEKRTLVGQRSVGYLVQVDEEFETAATEIVDRELGY